MKILFIENRYSTLVWDLAAQALVEAGHEIYWLIQNHEFTPTFGHSIRIPYPKRSDLSDEPLDSELESIARTDRALRYFNAKPRHYLYYRDKIKQIIDGVEPDIVFGEATQFHELITLGYCKSTGRLFISPCSSRYPSGRLFFYLNDTFKAVGGCGIAPDESELVDLVRKINARALKPSYMEPTHQSFSSKIMRHIENARILLGWVKGERFITPSPWRRFQLNRTHTRSRAKWDLLAHERQDLALEVIRTKKWVLYPLQLQPESNLDVYGQPWSNQRDTMERAAESLAQIGAYLIVKPNPKSKYEIDDLMVSSARLHPNIVPMPHSSAMSSLFEFAPLCLSVTGTIILECILKNKPIGVLGSHKMSTLPGTTALNQPEDISAALASCWKQNQIPDLDVSKGTALLADLYKTSYDALIWCPITRPDLFQPDCILKLQKAFLDFVGKLESHSLQVS